MISVSINSIYFFFFKFNFVSYLLVTRQQAIRNDRLNGDTTEQNKRSKQTKNDRLHPMKKYNVDINYNDEFYNSNSGTVDGAAEVNLVFETLVEIVDEELVYLPWEANVSEVIAEAIANYPATPSTVEPKTLSLSKYYIVKQEIKIT